MPKVLPALTQRQIDAALRRREDQPELRDGAVKGLVLRVGATYATWNLVRRGRNGLRMRLGEYPATTLPEARKLAQRASDSHIRDIGIKPQQPEEVTGSKHTLAHIMNLYQDNTDALPRTWYDMRSACFSVFKGVWRRQVDTLTSFDLQKAVDAYAITRSKFVAGSAARYIRPAIKWAARRGYCERALADFDPPKRAIVTRERVLSSEEIRAIWPFLVGEYGRAAKMMFLTLSRREEVCQATVAEFNMENSLWTIPAARRKNENELEVPLSRQAMELVAPLLKDEKGQFKKKDALVFGNTVGGVLSNWNRWQHQINTVTGTSGWHRHDLRRTAATISGNIGTPPHIVEAMLGHLAVFSSLARVYNKSRYLPEQREALQALADQIEQIIT